MGETEKRLQAEVEEIVNEPTRWMRRRRRSTGRGCVKKTRNRHAVQKMKESFGAAL